MTPKRLKELLKEKGEKDSVIALALDYIEYLERSGCDCCRNCEKGKE